MSDDRRESLIVGGGQAAADWRIRVTINTAIEVVKKTDHYVPGPRHWAAFLFMYTSGDAAPANQLAACGSQIVGCVMTAGTVDSLTCDDCRLEYVRYFLGKDDDAPGPWTL